MDPPSTAPAAPSQGQKTYVFVDEYNRHKRLKVMRACDGCRKRKIRCDGALQNGPWPCGACIRLKLKCVPPSLESEEELLSTPDSATSSNQFTFRAASPANSQRPGDSPSQASMTHAFMGMTRSATLNHLGPTSAPAVRPDGDGAVYSTYFLGQQLEPRFDQAYSDDEYFAATPESAHSQSQLLAMPSLMRTQTGASNGSSGDPEEVDATVRELSGQMGDLSIDLTSVAPYITRETQILAESETPAVEEPEVELPPSVSTDSTVHIPPEMMPHEERALDYFGYFFNYIHPYVPVLHREKFYEQWRTARQTISPLILEGIFACVAQYLEDQIEVRRWLALAARHEESYKDVPRLSTVQGLLLLAKAREAVPRRGYYYRSWMQLKYVATMAIDLGLNEHRNFHNGEDTCTLSRSDCMLRTRIWQTLFMLEILVGGSQGRSDFSVGIETVDAELPNPSSELSDFEYQTTRRIAYFTQVFLNIKRTNDTWQKMRKIPGGWPTLDPQFVQYNEPIVGWINKLPPDMQIEYTTTDEPPLLRGKHYVAYLHIYHHLVVIMHHRPQLQTLVEARDPAFRKYMDICNESATSICRIQEALHRDFGLHGLHFMLRGIGFTIYCILTSTMLHLATITAPDEASNSRARMYFTRHMRMLEHCIPSATPDIRNQIDSLREAFSQDITKPFELKPTLGRRSPSAEPQNTPLIQEFKQRKHSDQTVGSWPSLHEAPPSRTLSNASDYSQPFEDIPTQNGIAPPPTTNYAPVNLHRVTSAPQPGFALEPVIGNENPSPVWDPSNIFNQWHAAFGQPAPMAVHTHPPVDNVHPAVTAAAASAPPPMPSPSAPFTTQPRIAAAPQILYPPPRPEPLQSPIVPEHVTSMPSVTPVMWQNAFTTAYVSGQGRKRYREEESLEFQPYHEYRDSKV